MGGHRDRSLTAHAGLPTHRGHRTYDLGRPAEGREPEEAAEGLGLRCRRRLEFAPGAGSRRTGSPGQLGRELEPGGQGWGVLGPWTRGGQRAWRGRGQARDAACCHCRPISAALAASWGKVLGWIAAWGPLSAGPHLRPPASPVPARVPLGARHSPPGRAPRGGAGYIQPGPGRPRVPGAAAASRRGTRGGEPRPSPRRPSAGR